MTKKHCYLTSTKNNGFTLIELSIVLVIIGLIIGSVMVGRNLIETGKIRSQIAQFQEYQTALHSFKLKYNCFPGDCASATALGLGANGDDNGLLQSSTPSNSSYDTPDGLYDGEFPLFFLHLQATNFINYNLGGTFTTGGGKFPLLAIGDKYGMIAAGKWHLGWTATIPNYLTTNYKFPDGWWLHATICGNLSAPIGANDGCGTMTAAQAQTIDLKTDDGNPLYGKVWAYTSGIAPANANLCVLGGNYALTNPYANCQVSFRMQ